MSADRPAGASDRSADSASSASSDSSTAAVRRQGQADAWGASSLVVAGVCVWGGAGAALGAWLSSDLPVMVGLLLGMTSGQYLVWLRYGRALGPSGRSAAPREASARPYGAAAAARPERHRPAGRTT